jgi:divalent metal cation (Fe/Co/Zn/Cd) transporter
LAAVDIADLSSLTFLDARAKVSPDRVGRLSADTIRRMAEALRARELMPVIRPGAPPSLPASERARLVRRTRALAWVGVGWHVLECAIAVAAGLAASSIALIGFGIDSAIESAAGLVVVWLFASRRAGSATAERRAQRLIAGSFFALAAYVAFEAVRSLAAGSEAGASWVGIGLAAVTAPTMPLLARYKTRLGRQLGSHATVSEGAQTMLCAYLSVGLLVGLGANAVLGWWWADPLCALAIGGVAVREGVLSWRGESDGCCAAC